jgi:hypothetical protein
MKLGKVIATPWRANPGCLLRGFSSCVRRVDPSPAGPGAPPTFWSPSTRQRGPRRMLELPMWRRGAGSGGDDGRWTRRCALGRVEEGDEAAGRRAEAPPRGCLVSEIWRWRRLERQGGGGGDGRWIRRCAARAAAGPWRRSLPIGTGAESGGNRCGLERDFRAAYFRAAGDAISPAAS